MSSTQTLSIALKEWATVCRALERGRQIVLLRKGGIYEAAGEFEVEHDRFLLFPTYLHQNPAMLKAEAHGDFEQRSSEPLRIELRAWCQVSDIIQLSSRRQIEAIDAEHIWTPPLIEMRFKYRPENPLYLLIVRSFVLAEPVTVENTIAYAGCKSWVPLEAAVDVSDARPALPDDQFERRRMRIREALKSEANSP